MDADNAEKWMNFLKKAHDGFLKLAAELKFDASHPWHRNLIAFYCTIIELAGTVIVMIDRKTGIGVPIIVRSMAEAFVDLKNSINDRKYGYYLEVNYFEQWIKILEEAKKGNNDYLREITNAECLDDTISEWKKEKQEIEQKGYRSLKIFEKFRMANMEDDYRSTYNSLCADSHNNLRALVSRHIEIDGKNVNLVLYKDYTLEENFVYIGHAVEVLVEASDMVHTTLESSAILELKDYLEELKALREKLN